MRRPKIERWLTFLVSLCVIAFVGFCAWFVIDATSQKFVAKLSNQELVESAGGTQPQVAHFQLAFSFVATSLIFLLAFAAWHRCRFFQFRDCVRAIESVGGTVRFSNGQEATLMAYLFGNVSVDLSDTDVNDALLPDLRYIPNLVCLRIAGTRVTEKAVCNIARCRKLESLDVSGTRIRADHFDAFDEMKSLNSILCE